MTSKKHDRQQPTLQLWTPLPEHQQEQLSGGSPRIIAPPPSGTGGAPIGGSSETTSLA